MKNKMELGQLNLKSHLRSFALISTLLLAACSKPEYTPTDISAEISGTIQDQTVSQSSEGILGGISVSKTDALAQTTVQVLNLVDGASCTGSLIYGKFVLTAAHCTTERAADLVIVFSTKIPQSRAELAKMTLRRVSAGKTSDLWPKLNASQEKDWGDIAILMFDGSLPAGYRNADINKSTEILKKGSEAILAGYGLTDGVNHTESSDLRKVTVRIADGAFSKTEIMFDQTSGKGACHGDSGGPAFSKVGNKMVVVGVTSRGHSDPNDTCLRSSLYTNVGAWSKWIDSTVSAMNSNKKAFGIMPQPY